MGQYTSTALQADHAYALRERTDLRFARTLANIARRAETLFTGGGYTATESFPGLFFVTGPQGQTYTVICDAKVGHHCTCPAYAEYGECKHHLAVAAGARGDARWEALAAEHDAEEARYSAFDPYEFRH